MTFVRRALLVVPGFGTPIQNDALFLSTGTTVTTSGTTITLGSLAPAIHQGYVRIKVYSGSTNGTLTSVKVTMTDGTTTETCYNNTDIGGTSVGTNAIATLVIPFESELDVNSVSVVITTTTQNALADVEIAAGN